MHKKSTKIWIILLVLPVALLLLTAVAQIAIRFTNINANSVVCDTGLTEGIELNNNPAFESIECPEPEASEKVLNVITVVSGIIALPAILLSPLWIIMLMMAVSHNKKLETPTINPDVLVNQQKPTDSTPELHSENQTKFEQSDQQ